MTRLCSLPFVIAPEEAGRNAFAKLLRRGAVLSLRSFPRANLYWLRRSGHFGSWTFLRWRQRPVFSRAPLCASGSLVSFWVKVLAVWNWRVKYLVGAALASLSRQKEIAIYKGTNFVGNSIHFKNGWQSPEIAMATRQGQPLLEHKTQRLLSVQKNSFDKCFCNNTMRLWAVCTLGGKNIKFILHEFGLPWLSENMLCHREPQDLWGWKWQL